MGGTREMMSRRGHERGKGEMFWHMQERYRVKHQEERRKKKIEKKRKKKNRVVRQGKQMKSCTETKEGKMGSGDVAYHVQCDHKEKKRKKE